MERIAVSAIMIVGALSMGGCAINFAGPLPGSIYTDVKFGDTATSVTSTLKKGKACAVSILGLVALGDASVATAKTNGGVTEVSSVDHTDRAILGVWAEHCTVVRGG